MTKSQRKKFIKNAFLSSEVSVLLEDVYSEIRVVGEGHGSLNKKIDNLDVSLSRKINNLDVSLNEKIDNISDSLNDFIKETRENFKVIQRYLSRIEDDFIALRKKIDHLDKTKVSSKDFNWLKSKVLEIENQLEEYKKQQTALAAKI